MAGLAGADAPETAFGAMLPDLLGMVRVRVDVASLSPGVGAGVAVHHQADELFHQHHTFVVLAGTLRDSLTALGLPAGASRAIGHVGTELLLDGRLAGDAGIVVAFQTALGAAADVDELLAEPGRTRWRQLRRWLPSAHPDDYADPAAVAERLHRILDRRPRLAFDRGQRDQLADVLADHLTAVADAAPRLFADVATGLTPTALPPPPLDTGR